MKWGACEQDRDELAQALRAWNATYRVGMGDRDAYDALLKGAIASLSDEDRAALGAEPAPPAPKIPGGIWDRVGGFAARWQAYARWAHSGYPILESSQEYAAALMSTRTSMLEEDDLRLPWGSLLAVVPEGLLEDEQGRCLDRVRIDGNHRGVDEGLRVWVYSSSSIEGGIRGYHPPGETTGRNLLAMLRGDVREPDALDGRILRCAGKYVVGLLVALEHTNNFVWRDVKARPKSGPWSRGEPAHRVAFVGRPLSVNATSAVVAYVSGQKRALPSVQTLVRGHYKRQVMGVSGSARKVIWIEPYWRGPEDAPILARPYRVGGSDG